VGSILYIFYPCILVASTHPLLRSLINYQVLDYLKTENLLRAPVVLRDLCWRFVNDEKFFYQVVDVLRACKIYCNEIWAFAVKYSKDEVALREYLSHHPTIVRHAGPYLMSTFVTRDIEKIWVNEYQHLE